MNLKTLLGIILIVVGLGAAITGIAGIGQDAANDRSHAPIVGDQNSEARSESASIVVPLIAGLSLAGGAALIGIGMGRFSRPKVIPPDSPNEGRAETTRPLH